jgi:3-deoxy-D-manno-octulosonate 8-phosphate phosphatase (KDO 8-P phosphatase)
MVKRYCSGAAEYPSDCEITEGLRQRASRRAAANGQDQVRGYAWKNCLERAARIKLLLLDVDGVLTDSTIVYGPEGSEMKAFSTRDGLGIRLLREAGVETGLITARSSTAVQRRAEDLKLRHVYQGVGKKIEALTKILATENLGPEEVAYMGDDWLDLPVMLKVGLAAAVADARPEVRAVAHYVTIQPGGRGAVRELCELIIEGRGQWERLLAAYTSGNY